VTDTTAPPRPKRRRNEPIYEFENDFVDPDEEFVPIRVESPVGRRVVNAVVATFVALACVAGFSMVWAMRQMDPPGEQGGQVAAIEVPRGATLDSISLLLESKAVIASADVFGWYAKIRGVGGAWKAGTYVNFRENSTMSQAASVLADGPVPPQSTAVTVIPGARLVDSLESIAKAFPALTVETLAAALASGQVTSKYLLAGQTNWEGLLAPDTYQFAKDSSAVTVLQKLADQQAEVLDGLGYGRAEALSGRTAYELLTIASLVEKEAGDPEEEKPRIARVIENRLDRGDPLGIDAAILYGLNRRNGGLTADDLAQDTPYENRRRVGLPPTPIALPGQAALRAAIQPAAGDWQWYVLVTKNPSTHLFTSDYNEFLKAKDRAQAEGIF